MGQSVEIQMERIANEYQVKLKADSEKICKKHAMALARTLRSTSPGSGEYASGWTQKKLDERTYVVYNKAKPGLTHLLEKGHLTMNQFGGPYRRTPAHPHIGPATEAEKEAFIADMEDAT